MEKEKNNSIGFGVDSYLKVNISMEKEMEKEENMIIIMENQYSKVNIYMDIKIKVKNITVNTQNMKENIYLVKNGTEKDMI